MKKVLLFLAVGLVAFTLSAQEKKHLSDKQRIEALETELAAVKADLAGEHEWAMHVNDGQEILDERTLDLNSRLLKLEGRGPVAKEQR